MTSTSSRPTAALPNSDWWMFDIQIRIIEFVYSAVQARGVESALLDPDSLEGLVSDRKLDTAIRQAYKLRPPRPQGDGDTTDRTPNEWEWNNDKRKILECLVPIHRARTPHDSVNASKNQPSILQKPSQGYEIRPSQASPGPVDHYSYHYSYHTPAETPGTLPDRASSETSTIASDHTITVDDLHPRRNSVTSSPFSPPETASRGGSRRRRSSSSMQNEKPGKRARGPQEHMCEICRKKFPFLSKLTDHKKTHSTEKALRCRHCNKSFKRTREVNAHLKSVHKIDNPLTHQQQQLSSAPPTPAPLQLPPHHTAPSPHPPPTPGGHILLPLTPGAASSTLLLPPPNPRAPTYMEQQCTPQSTPGQFNEPTPGGPEDYETQHAITPRDPGYRDDTDIKDVKPRLRESLGGMDLVAGVRRVTLSQQDFDNVKLPPIRNLTQPQPQLQPPTKVEPEDSHPNPSESKERKEHVLERSPLSSQPSKDISSPKCASAEPAGSVGGTGGHPPGSDSDGSDTRMNSKSPSPQEKNIEDYTVGSLFGRFQD